MRGFIKSKYEKSELCNACSLAKQVKRSFKSISDVATNRVLQLLQMDLFGPTRNTSLGGKMYCLVIMNDYSRFEDSLKGAQATKEEEKYEKKKHGRIMIN